MLLSARPEAFSALFYPPPLHACLRHINFSCPAPCATCTERECHQPPNNQRRYRRRNSTSDCYCDSAGAVCVWDLTTTPCSELTPTPGLRPTCRALLHAVAAWAVRSSKLLSWCWELVRSYELNESTLRRRWNPGLNAALT
ncbi:hypothetical protein BaRGS_00000502 [Batillaria attramentaria]|uniref:Uncharacterized protein n=1 Tax=Batillaria attramentaria TaxID=370345 RepID=A0ABD0MAR9_9CAEN